MRIGYRNSRFGKRIEKNSERYWPHHDNSICSKSSYYCFAVQKKMSAAHTKIYFIGCDAVEILSVSFRMARLASRLLEKPHQQSEVEGC